MCVSCEVMVDEGFVHTHTHTHTRTQNTDPGFSIFTVNATDRDAGVNGMVVFSLQDTSLPFAISSVGVVTVEGTLDRERQTDYTVRD